MIAIRLNAVIGDDRKLIVQLPEDTPTGEVEVVVRTPVAPEITEKRLNTARETAKRKLKAAGALVTDFDVPSDAHRLSVEERMRIGTLPDNAQSSLDLINGDRGEW